MDFLILTMLTLFAFYVLASRIPLRDVPKDVDPALYKDETRIGDKLHPYMYKNYGLYHSISELEAISVKEFCSFSLEKQMEYTDAITRKYAMNKEFKDMQRDITVIEDIDSINITGIANLAWMMYYNPDEPKWKEAHDKIVVHYAG